MLQPHDREVCWSIALTALCIWREARGESYTAKLAVAWIIRNRVEARSWFGNGYAGVILKPQQFSSFNAHDPNATRFPDPKDPSWPDCLTAAALVILEAPPDPTGGATHYHSALTPDQLPLWTHSGELRQCFQAGKLTFYKPADTEA